MAARYETSSGTRTQRGQDLGTVVLGENAAAQGDGRVRGRRADERLDGGIGGRRVARVERGLLSQRVRGTGEPAGCEGAEHRRGKSGQAARGAFGHPPGRGRSHRHSRNSSIRPHMPFPTNDDFHADPFRAGAARGLPERWSFRCACRCWMINSHLSWRIGVWSLGMSGRTRRFCLSRSRAERQGRHSILGAQPALEVVARGNEVPRN